MDCRHRQEFPGLTHCHLVNQSVRVCGECETQWPDGKCPDVPTPVLIGLLNGRTVAARPAPPPKLTLPQKIANAARAFAAFVRSGGKLLDAPDVAARLAICDGCDKRGTFLRASICTICGCALRLKTQMPTEHCPLGKWAGDPEKRPCGKPCGT